MINPTGNLFISYHWHREVEIIYLIEGSLTVTVSGEQFKLHPGDIYFVNSQELHQFSSMDETTYYYAYVFPMESLNFAIADYSQTLYIQPIIRKELLFPRSILQSASCYLNVVREVKELIEMNEASSKGYQLGTKASLYKIISYLIEGNHFQKALSKNSSYPYVKAENLKLILTYLQEHYNEPLKLADIADTFHMSSKYFCKYFKQNFSKTFVEYLNHYRIEKASVLLLTTGMSVMDIGFQVGFDNFSYFIKKFREITGVTPAKYRANISISNPIQPI
jgi:AraC-like DNA-binding protein